MVSLKEYTGWIKLIILSLMIQVNIQKDQRQDTAMRLLV